MFVVAALFPGFPSIILCWHFAEEGKSEKPKMGVLSMSPKQIENGPPSWPSTSENLGIIFRKRGSGPARTPASCVLRDAVSRPSVPILGSGADVLCVCLGACDFSSWFWYNLNVFIPCGVCDDHSLSGAFFLFGYIQSVNYCCISIFSPVFLFLHNGFTVHWTEVTKMKDFQDFFWE